MVRKHTKKKTQERFVYPIAFKLTEEDYTNFVEFIDQHRPGYTISSFVREIILTVMETGKYDIRDSKI